MYAFPMKNWFNMHTRHEFVRIMKQMVHDDRFWIIAICVAVLAGLVIFTMFMGLPTESPRTFFPPNWEYMYR